MGIAFSSNDKAYVSLSSKNKQGESPIDIVSGEWNQGLSDFYSGLSQALKLNIDLEKVRAERPRIAEILRDANKE